MAVRNTFLRPSSTWYSINIVSTTTSSSLKGSALFSIAPRRRAEPPAARPSHRLDLSRAPVDETFSARPTLLPSGDCDVRALYTGCPTSVRPMQWLLYYVRYFTHLFFKFYTTLQTFWRNISFLEVSSSKFCFIVVNENNRFSNTLFMLVLVLLVLINVSRLTTW